MGYIYKLTFPSEKSYIGQTIQTIEKRFQAHQYASSSCVAVYNAIQKYGWENVKKEWYECPDEDLNFDENLLVALLGTLAPGGYNLMEGGGSKGRPSEETKQKISKANLGKTRTEETKQKISEAHTGKTLGEETKQKISDAHTGKTLSEETKQKLSDAQSGEKNPNYGKTGKKSPNYGKTHTEETKKKMSDALSGEKHYNYGKTLSEEIKQKMSDALSGEKNHNSKKVYQYTINGTYVDSYGSSGEAARALGKINGSLIRMCARGKQSTAYGFKWSREKL